MDEEGKINPNYIVWLFELEGSAEKLENVTLVVNSACKSFSPSWIKLFTEKLGAACYIAPQGCPTFEEGLVFPVTLYLKMWNKAQEKKRVTKDIVKTAFNEAKNMVNTTARWKLPPLHS